MSTSNLRLSAMRALWGVVTPNLRAVSVQEKNNTIFLYFYYNKMPSEIEIELSEEAATEVISDFPEPFLINCNRNIVKFPEKIEFAGYLIYFRYEK